MKEKELPIIQKTYDLIQWYVPLLNRLPRDHKFALGDRVVGGLYDRQDQYRRHEIGIGEISQSLRSWIAHLEHGDTWHLRENIFSSLVFAREKRMGCAAS